MTTEELNELEVLLSAVPTLAGPWVSCENGAVGCGHITEEQDEETGQRLCVAAQHVVCGTDDRFIREYICFIHNHARALIRSAKRERLLQAEVEATREAITRHRDNSDSIMVPASMGTRNGGIGSSRITKMLTARASTDLFDQENPA